MSKKRCAICRRPKARKGLLHHGVPRGTQEALYALGGLIKSLGLKGVFAHVSCLQELRRKRLREAQKRGLQIINPEKGTNQCR